MSDEMTRRGSFEDTSGSEAQGEKNTPEIDAFCCTAEAFNITPQQLQAIRYIMAGEPENKIARDFGINRSTLWRWKTLDPNYQRALAEFRAQACAATMDDFQWSLNQATQTLAKLLKDPCTTTRLRAAHTLLGAAGRFKHREPERVKYSEPEPDLPEKVG